MSKTTRIVIASLAIVLAFAIAFLLIPYMNEQTRETTTVLRVTKEIKENTLIEETMLTTAEVGRYNYPSDAITNMEQVVGKYAKVDLLPSDVLTPDKFIADSENEDKVLHNLATVDGRRAVSVTLDGLSASVGAKILPGDVVSVYSIQKTGASTNNTVTLYPELEYVEVQSITNAMADNVDLEAIREREEEKASEGSLVSSSQSERVPSIVTLLVSPDQATRLIKAEANGKVHLVLVGRGEETAEMLANAVTISEEDEPVEYIQNPSAGVDPTTGVFVGEPIESTPTPTPTNAVDEWSAIGGSTPPVSSTTETITGGAE